MQYIQKSFHYFRILLQLMRIGLVRKSHFRVEFFSQVIMDTVWYLSHLLIFEILYLHTVSIAGWEKPQMRVLLGCLFVSDAFMMAWMGQQWHFGNDLKNGKLDPFRVRPASPIFLYFFQRFSPEGFTNLFFGFSYLLYALSVVTPHSLPCTLFFLGWSVLLSWWGRGILLIFFSTVEFYILNSNLGHFMNEFHMAAEDRPLDIFSARIRSFLIFILPVGALSYIPACFLLGKVSVFFMAFFSLWLFAMGLAIFRFWNFSFRRYESAMG